MAPLPPHDLTEENAELRRRLAELQVDARARRTIEDKLREQEARLRLILDGVRDHAVSMLDPSGNVETFNAPAERIKGYALSEVQGQSFRMFFTPDDRAAGLPEHELEVARTHGRYEGEGWRQRKDGSRFYAAVSLSALHNAEGKLVGFVKVTQDRTRYREMAAALAQRETQLGLIIDTIPGLVAYIAPDQTYRLANAAYERWFGRAPETIVGASLLEVLGPDAYAIVRPRIEAALGGTRASFEAELPYRDGGSRWVRVMYVPDIRSDGAVEGCVSLVLDVTEERAAEQRLAEEAQVNEALSRLGLALTSDVDLDEFFARLTEEATALCGAQFGAFFYNVTSPEGDKYMLYTLAGVPREKFAGFPMPRSTAIFAPTFGGEGVVRSGDITRDPRYGKSGPHHGMPKGHLPVRSYLAVPVMSGSGEVHGGLFFGHADADVFTEPQERMIVAIAAQAAIAISRARLHQATAAAEAKYRALAESSPQLVWTTTPDGATEYCNAQFLDFVGLSLEEMQRAPRWGEIVHPDDVANASRAWSRALASGGGYEVEYRLRRASDGSYRWFLARGSPIREEGRVVRWVGSCTDIDDRKRGEDTHRFLSDAGALLSSSLDYRATLPDLARLAVPHMADWCTIELADDPSQLQRIAVAHFAPARVRLVEEITRRYPADELDASRRIARTGVAERIAEVTDEMLVAAARDADHLELLRAVGVRSWMAVPIKVQSRTLGVISFASSESGRLFAQRDLELAEEVGRRVGAVLDSARLYEMTQRERLRAEEASRAKDELLSVTSHELRTPLNAILGWSRLLRGGALAEDKRARALETIERNAELQGQLIEDLLDVSRVITGRLRLTVAPVDVIEVIEAAIDVVRPAADAKSVRVQVVLDPGAGHVQGDAGRLQQVAWNLLSNAVKFTPKGGRVHVSLTREDSHVELVVSDSGEGISPEFLPHVFQPFRQQDGSVTRKHGGLGLGLAIVKHLVELHGGSIRATSEGIDRGASFVVRLPIAPLRSASAAPPDRPVVSSARRNAGLRCPPELSGMDVLVVDDEPDALDLLRSVLEQCSAKVRTARSVAEALELFAARIPDVVVSDIGMPDESGYALIRKIRALSPEKGGRTPAVALTAYASMDDRTRALLEGYTNHCGKPMEPQELVAVIAAVTGRIPRT